MQTRGLRKNRMHCILYTTCARSLLLYIFTDLCLVPQVADAVNAIATHSRASATYSYQTNAQSTNARIPNNTASALMLLALATPVGVLELALPVPVLVGVPVLVPFEPTLLTGVPSLRTIA